ncbi:MAG: hypothetical protein KBC00_03330 [Candidatus Levybacteria bacterium]|nr:hypothetical protein [Candidatus Levybacteria bacterium]MBP9814911.1 hypothetical protein [Candidatus Levybacteria bacterium]
MEPRPGKTPEPIRSTRSEYARIMDGLEEKFPKDKYIVGKFGEKTESEDTRALFVRTKEICVMTIDGPYKIVPEKLSEADIIKTDSKSPTIQTYLETALKLLPLNSSQKLMNASYTAVDGEPLLKVNIRPNNKPELEYNITPDQKNGYSISPITMEEFNKSIKKASELNK